MELETHTQDAPSTFDPALIPAPPLHSCPIQSDMSFTAAGAAFDEWLWPIERRKNSQWAMQMWKANCTSHICTAPTATAGPMCS
jgi:hypothetical protein